ncbi:MAG: HD domain-containing phosphohydrolase [Oscillospiraceae bacterium]
MNYCKLQIGCLVVVLYVAFIFFRGCRRYHRNPLETPFSGMLVLSIITLFFDGATAYTVNHLDTVNDTLNRVFHAIFLGGLDAFIFSAFLYILYVTGFYPKKKRQKILIYTPVLINVAVVILSVGSLEFRKGEISNYSMGMTAYTCFIMVGIYLLLAALFCIRGFHNIKREKRDGIITVFLVVIVVTVIQMIFPQTLITSIAVTMILLGIYMNFEDNALKELSHYYHETVLSFANLVENRDKNTGGHIRRTAKYVELIAEELKRMGVYKNVLTKDYVDNLINAAPMHDIGKIAVPDAVLQKPGKLTDEEYAIMQTHAEVGGNIIQETFSNLGNEDYCLMAYRVARHHHEKWNGKGYPDGLTQVDIPVCARIMAVADVFDAVSERRCYRDAMPLDRCFKIIEEGSGKDFDPLVVEAFLNIRDKVEAVHKEFADEQSSSDK